MGSGCRRSKITQFSKSIKDQYKLKKLFKFPILEHQNAEILLEQAQ